MSDATLAGLIDDAIFCFKHDVDSAQVALALIDRLAPRLERMGEDSSRLLQARRHIVGDGQYGAGDSGDVAVTQPGAVIWLERLALPVALGPGARDAAGPARAGRRRGRRPRGERRRRRGGSPLARPDVRLRPGPPPGDGP